MKNVNYFSQIYEFIIEYLTAFGKEYIETHRNVAKFVASTCFPMVNDYLQLCAMPRLMPK